MLDSQNYKILFLSFSQNIYEHSFMFLICVYNADNTSNEANHNANPINPKHSNNLLRLHKQWTHVKRMRTFHASNLIKMAFIRYHMHHVIPKNLWSIDSR